MNRETSTVLMLDSFIALRWKSHSYSYANPNGIIQKKKQNKKEYCMRRTTKTLKIIYLKLN